MKEEEHRDRIVDLLLCELIGTERPPDVREKVLSALEEEQQVLAFPAKAPRPIPQLKSTRTSKWPMVAIAAAFAVLGSILALVHSQNILESRTPKFTDFTGVVDRQLGSLQPGETLTTGTDSTASLVYPDGTAVELLPETTIKIAEGSRWDRSKGIVVLSGGLSAEVQPQPEGKPMQYLSERARAEVVGTQLTFTVNDQGARLEVGDGAVKFVPFEEGNMVLVRSGQFAEVDESGFHHGMIKVEVPNRITGFSLMDGDTDQVIGERQLEDGEKITLSSLKTSGINIRVDYEGEQPARVKLLLIHRGGKKVKLPSSRPEVEYHPPYFLAGDHHSEGRPKDCRAWNPPLGRYRLVAEAIYENGDEGESSSERAVINFEVEK